VHLHTGQYSCLLHLLEINGDMCASVYTAWHHKICPVAQPLALSAGRRRTRTSSAHRGQLDVYRLTTYGGRLLVLCMLLPPG